MCKHVSERAKRAVEEMADRFVRHSPPVCEQHMPGGLPIEKPNNVEISDLHPHHKFNQIVDAECHRERDDDTDCEAIRSELVSVFSETFYQDSDPRSCIQCFKQADNNDGEAIRMDVPETFDSINDR